MAAKAKEPIMMRPIPLSGLVAGMAASLSLLSLAKTFWYGCMLSGSMFMFDFDVNVTVVATLMLMKDDII
jgi:hypothetical protein